MKNQATERSYPSYLTNRRRPGAFAPLVDWPAILLGRLAARPGVILNTLPKSASIFIWDALASNLGLVKCRIQVSDFPETLLFPRYVSRLAKGGVITQSHFGATRHNLFSLLCYGVNRMIVHVRDPRQSLLSWVHHVRKKETIFHPEVVALPHRPPQELVEGPLEDLISWHIEHYLPLEVAWIQGWVDVTQDPEWQDMNVLLLSFEEFKRDNEAYFRKIYELYEQDFSKFRLPPSKEGKLHFRKGQVSEWREVFTPAQIEMTKSIVPAGLLDRFGWEQA